MTLRKRFNVAFTTVFFTALVALLVVFWQSQKYITDITSSIETNQGAVSVERLRSSALEEAVRVEADPDRVFTQDHEDAMTSLEAGLDRMMELYRTIGPEEGQTTATEGVRIALERVSGSHFRDPVHTDQLSRALHLWAIRFQDRSVNVHAEATMTSLWVVALAAGICVLIAAEFGVFWILIRNWTIYPIAALAEHAQHLQGGESEYRLPVKRNDEVGMLAASLNEMVGRLRDRDRQLARSRELAAIGEICSGVAHGMRNPLAVIRLSAQRIAQVPKLGENDAALLEEIIQQVDRLDARITRLLRFANSIEPRYEPVEFQWLSGVAVRESTAALDERGLRIDVIDDTRGIACLMDPDLAVQAVVECISNSAHHSPDGSTITLRGHTLTRNNGHGPEWVVSIEDHGRGIEPQVMGNIFDLFFTLREHGTGVGLSMVKRIIDQHHGHIDVQSTPGEGTTVQLCLPLKNGV